MMVFHASSNGAHSFGNETEWRVVCPLHQRTSLSWLHEPKAAAHVER